MSEEKNEKNIINFIKSISNTKKVIIGVITFMVCAWLLFVYKNTNNQLTINYTVIFAIILIFFLVCKKILKSKPQKKATKILKWSGVIITGLITASLGALASALIYSTVVDIDDYKPSIKYRTEEATGMGRVLCQAGAIYVRNAVTFRKQGAMTVSQAKDSARSISDVRCRWFVQDSIELAYKKPDYVQGLLNDGEWLRQCAKYVNGY